MLKLLALGIIAMVMSLVTVQTVAFAQTETPTVTPSPTQTSDDATVPTAAPQTGRGA